MLVASLARKALVLGVEHPAAAELASSGGARRILWIATDGAGDGGMARAQDAVLGIASGVDGQAIVLRENGDQRSIAPVPRQWPASEPDARRTRQAHLTAIAIALGLGVDPGAMAEALTEP
jgi:hypothetical protein